MELQQLIGQQRIQHIVDSYSLAGEETTAFESYLSELLSQYPYGLIELALVETLIESWLTIPMEKGVPFLTKAHRHLKQWQQNQCEQPASAHRFTPEQFSQITGLDAQSAFDAIASATSRSTQAATESA